MNRWAVFSCLVVCFCFQACKITPPLITDIKSFEFKNTTSGATGVQVELKIKNPNSFALKIKKFDFELSINDKVLGKAYAAKKLKIGKQSEGFYPILLESDIKQAKSLLSGIGGLFQNKIEIKMKGSIKCGAGFLFSKKFKVEAKGKINLKDFF